MSTADDVRHLTAQSRVRLAAAEDIREQHRLLAVQCRRRLDAGRLLLERSALSGRV